MKLLYAKFGEQVERDLPGRLRRPRARTVRQSLVCWLIRRKNSR